MHNQGFPRCFRIAVLSCLFLGPSVHAQEGPTHGIAVGDVTSESAVVWGRCPRAAMLKVQVAAADGTVKGAPKRVSTTADSDFTAQVVLRGLEPNESYLVRTWCEDPEAAATATFRTAPGASTSRDVIFLVSGDLGGQTYCRLEDGGYQIFEPMAALKADFFVANGDMIYADNPCPAAGAEGKRYIDGGFPGVGAPSVDWTDQRQVDGVFRAHWKYNRADPAFQTFLAGTPIYVQWDDHEVINDFGAPWPSYPPAAERPGYADLVNSGRQSLFDFHPITVNSEEPGRIYRSFRWGKEVELFLLDARSYRSRNDRPDEDGGDGEPKTMLGKEQLEWLIDRLESSDATWKVVSNDVPLSIPTGSGASTYGRDAYASGATPFGAKPDFATTTGFETELLYLLGRLDELNVKNLVFVATDVHFASQVRYERDFNGDGESLRFFELVSGPLSAVKNPAPPALDPTLAPVYLYAEGGIFNFARVHVDVSSGRAVMRADVRDETGRVRPGSELAIEPE